MKGLKRYIIKLFCAVVVGLTFMSSLMDGIFDWIALDITNEMTMIIALVIYLGSWIAMLIGWVALFVYLLSKRIASENERYHCDKSLLLTHIAHDLKTPMTTILGYSKALCDDVITDEKEEKQMLKSIYEKTQRTNELLDLLFQYTKYDTLDFNLKLEVYDVARLLRELLADFYENFEERKINLQVEIPDEPILCKVDKMEWQRAMSNLIINAYMHNQEGANVRVSLSKTDKMIIAFADDGSPIPFEAVFEPFHCGDLSRHSKNGSGLGLSISKKIIEKHGGTISIEPCSNEYTKAFLVKMKGHKP